MKRAPTLTMLLLIFLFGLVMNAPVAARSPAQATAEAFTCDSVVPLVAQKLGPACNDMNKDQLCYGNQTVAVEYRDPAAAAQNSFKQVGNVIPLDTVKSITTGRLNLNSSEWGLAVMKTLADVPGATAGQAVTFVLYGDTTFQNLAPGTTSTTSSSSSVPPVCTAKTNRVTVLRSKAGPQEAQVQRLSANTSVNVLGRLGGGDWLKVDANGTTGWVLSQSLTASCNPNVLPLASDDPAASVPPSTTGVKAFYFTTGVGSQATCKNVPASGLLISSPKGQTVHFNANGIDLTISSHVLLQSQRFGQLQLILIGGHVTIQDCNRLINLQGGELINIRQGGANGLDAHALCSPLIITTTPLGLLNIDQLCKLVAPLGIDLPCNAQPDCPNLKINNFSAVRNPARLIYNRSGFPICAPDTLTWDVMDAENVTLNGQHVLRTGARNVCINAATTYTLQATCGTNSASSSVSINVQR